MKSLRVPLAIAVLLACVVFAPTAASQLLSLEEGVHYELIDPPGPVNTSDPDRIEVIDLFWYGCPQCATFEPMMRYWGERIRGDLMLTRAPGIWHEVMETHARIFYTAGALGMQPQVHAAAFRAVHEQGNPLHDEAQVREFFAAQGVSAERFEEAWNSPEVAAAVETARATTAEYGLEKLPSLVVHGRYRVTQNAAVPTHDDMVVVANLLIREIRSLRRPD